LALVLYFSNFDSLIEKGNNLLNPPFNISVINPSLNNDGVLDFEVLLENDSDHPITVGKLELTYIVIPTRVNYEKRNRNILVRKIIDKNDDLSVYVILSDYYNPEVLPEAESWLRLKKKSFGIEISVKDKADDTIK